MARILIVEDMPTEAELLKVLCESEGHAVILAPTAGAALDYLAGDDFDLLLVDIALPGMDGNALISQLRGEPRFAEIPVLVLTAWNVDAVVPALKGLKVAEVIHKPYDIRMVRRSIQGLLG